MDLKLSQTTGPLIELFFHVYRTLGYGFIERVYQNAMVIASKRFGLDIRVKVPILVKFEGVIAGKYEADVVVNNTVICELKTAKALAPEHEAQLLNYLKATPYEVGFLLNFGPKPRYKRLVFDNSRKGSLSWVTTPTRHRRTPI